MGAMRGFLEAVSFLTIIPVARAGMKPGPGSLGWLPAVGLLLGCVWGCFDLLSGYLFSPGLRALVDVLFLILLTGGLHLDGLADTADGLFSRRGREEALRIMKDSRIGTWGVLALVLVLGLKTLALLDLPQQGRFLSLLLVPAYGRLSMLVGLRLLPYGRGQEGIAHDLIAGSGGPHWIWWAGILLLGSLALGWPEALLLNLAFGLVLLGCLSLYSSRMGCITGDMAGALGEITETGMLVALSVRL